MILSAIVENLKRRSKNDFKGRHFEASLILQAVCWYLRYPLSYLPEERRMTAAKRDGRTGMAASLGGDTPAITARSLRHLIPPQMAKVELSRPEPNCE